MKTWKDRIGAGLFTLLIMAAAAVGAVTGSSLNAPIALNEMNVLLAGEDQTLNQIYTSNSGLTTRYISTGDKNVSATPGEIIGFFSASGTSVTVTPYNDPDGTCSSNQVVGTISLTNGVFTPFPSRYSFGICVTVGGTNPDLIVVYRSAQ